MHYLSTQNSAGAGIYEPRVMENSMDFNKSYNVPQFTWNNPSVPSIEFCSGPNIPTSNANFPPSPPQYQSYYNSNNGFASPEMWGQNIPATPASRYMCERPQQTPYRTNMTHTYGLPYVPQQQKVKKAKRIRTAFTTNQIIALEQEYAGNKYLDTKRRFHLAATLQLKERAIKIWFQNRRMKEKKDRFEEAQEQLESVSTTTNPPGPGTPAYQSSSYFGAFNERIDSASTSTASPPAEIDEGTSTGYFSPEMTVQYPPLAYEHVTAQCQYVAQQSVPCRTSPQTLETLEAASLQLENILANNNKALAEVDSDWIQSLLFGEV